MSNLRNLQVKETIKPVIYDKENNVSIQLKYVPRSNVQDIMNRNTKIEFDRRTHKPEEKLNGEALAKDMAKTLVKGWSGMTYKYFASLVALDLSSVEDTSKEVEFNEDNLMLLVEESYDFSSWLMDTIREASNFTKQKEAELKN